MSGRRSGGAARAAGGFGIETLAWTLVAWGLWLVSLSAVGTPDLLVGGLCALACGAAAAGVRRLVGQHWRPEASLARPLLALPAAVVLDACGALAAPWRRDRGAPAVRREHLPGAAGPTARSAARRAVVAAVVSATPASVVLDVRRDSGEITVHTVRAPGRPLLDRYLGQGGPAAQR